MYLKQIVINGFKSFADRTELALEPGVTCIVGPNGCGKSNIVDAIRWVLGEQSAKALRGGKMQDVIFEGTDKRKPLSLCEVSLTFSNCEEALGAGFNEVELTRRVTRDSSSEYLINGKSCRLKDIQRLFMDTGIGRVSYSFLVQGQIDQILSSNPAERRIIFEEAAGITKYKSQRQEALNKLAHVDQNLARVTDVLDEMSRQLASLERQARKAVRYQHLKHRYNHLDLADQAHRYSLRHQTWEALDRNAHEKRTLVEAQQLKVSAQEGDLEKLRYERGVVYEKLRETQERTFNIKAELDQSHNKIQICEARLQDLDSKAQSINEEIARLETKREKLSSERQSEQAVHAEQVGAVGESDGVLKTHQDALQAAQKALCEVESALAQKKSARSKLEESHERLRSEAMRHEVELKSLEAQSAHLQSNSASLTKDLEDAQRALQEAEAAQQTHEAERIESQNGVQSAQTAVQTKLEAFKETQRQIQEQDRALARLNAERQVLEDMQAKFEGFSEGAKAILQGKLSESMSGSVKPAMRSMDIDADCAVAIETLLGAASDCLALETLQDALPWVRALEAKKLGRACFQVPVSRGHAHANPELPVFLKPTSAVARTLESELEVRVQGFFEGTYVADSLEEFLSFWEKNPTFNFLLIATQAGELIDARGLVFGGNRAPASGKTSVLQRDAQIRTLKKQIESEQTKLMQMRSSATEAQQFLADAEKALDNARQLVMQVGQKVSASAAQKRAAEDLVKRAQQSLERRQNEENSLATRIQAAQQRFSHASEQSQGSDSQKVEIDTVISSLEADVTSARATVDAKRETLSAVQLDFLQKRQRLELLNSELNQLESELRGTEHRLQHLRHDLGVGVQEKASHTKDIEHHKALRVDLDSRLQAEQQALQETQQGLIKTEQSIREFEEQLNGLRQALRTEEHALSSLEVRRAEEHAQVLFLEERARVDYNQEISAVDLLGELKAAYSPFKLQPPLDAWVDEEDQATILKKSKLGEVFLPEDPAEIDWEQIGRELKELKSRISSLGAVNLVAIEEYTSLKERHDFLKAQSDDLTNSKAELTAAIEQINETSEALFRTTFDQVRQNFKRTFEKLFGGGQSDLLLSEGEDSLNAGIEIVACPPGTRLKGLTLLSGGQKTMTAVALLFAIYQVKPSPFCVLDELDAPLDDANIGRFTQMLREFTEFSQFLVITHNKRTIGSADCIYGVTMPERGVTQLVSMRFAGKDTAAAQPVGA